MTIVQVKHVKSVGRFRNCAAKDDVAFKKFTLLFGENGRGKTTLCAILRSLQTNQPAFIVGRTTLGASSGPQVVIATTDGHRIFKAASWSAPHPDLRIFDAHYVSDNVYSGDAIGTEQRRNLCRVILGKDGVALAEVHDTVDENINASNASIREARNLLSAHAPGMKPEAFVAMKQDPDIVAKLEQKNRELEGLKQIDQLRTRPGLVPLELPPLPQQLEAILTKTLEDVSRDAEQIVRAHMSAHNMSSEDGIAWIAKGLPNVIDDNCPFCGQTTGGLDLLRAYADFFNESLQHLRAELTRYKDNASRLFSGERLELMSGRVNANTLASETWARYVKISMPYLDHPISLPGILGTFRNEMMSLLEQKLAAPLDPVAIPRTYTDALSSFAALTDAAQAYNLQVDQANALIDAFKKTADPTRIQAMEREAASLKLIQRRYEPAVVQACSNFVKLTAEKQALEKQKVDVREKLNQYSQAVMLRYQKAINKHLKNFTAGFHIDQVKIEYTGRVPNSTFCVVINDTPVDVGGPDTPMDQPSFRNTLSAGDRSTLALAFFLAELADDPDKSHCTVVFDDPFNSQDQFRRTCTIGEIRRCGDAVAQVIIMSHDRRFLNDIWNLPLPTADRKALSLQPVGPKDTIIVPWDIEGDTESEDAAHRRVLLAFYHNNKGDTRDVIQKLRPLAETHMRRIAGEQLANIKGLGSMIQKIREDKTPPPLLGVLDDLDDINVYTRRYMHGENPNAASEAVSAAELMGFVHKTLSLVGADPS